MVTLDDYTLTDFFKSGDETHNLKFLVLSASAYDLSTLATPYYMT